jgi:hypothetical protein
VSSLAKAGRAQDGKAPGQPCKLNHAKGQALARMIENGPVPALHGVCVWRLIDLGAMNLRGIPNPDRQADPQP